jgi:GT2 family glycosyltransferase
VPIEENAITVVICAYTTERIKILCETIASVQNQLLKPHQVILVIDHNQELLTLARATFSTIAVLENALPRGLSGSRNTGILAAFTPLVAFIDDDAVAEPDWLLNLAQRAQPADVLGVTGSIQPKWPRQPPDWLPSEFYWIVGCSYRGLPVATAEVRNLMGCSMLIKRKVFEDAGSFHYGLGRSVLGVSLQSCEETELCIRARAKFPESRFIFEPTAVVWHHVHAARLNWRYFRQRCFAEGVSKAKLTEAIGSQRTLSAEATYVARTLSTGCLRGLKAAILGRPRGGLRRAGAIVAGLSFVTAGYLVGKLQPLLSTQPGAPINIPQSAPPADAAASPPAAELARQHT